MALKPAAALLSSRSILSGSCRRGGQVKSWKNNFEYDSKKDTHNAYATAYARDYDWYTSDTSNSTYYR